MAPQMSTISFRAAVVLLASTSHTCSAAAAGGGVAQAFVGPDGVASLVRAGASAQAGVAAAAVDAPPWTHSAPAPAYPHQPSFGGQYPHQAPVSSAPWSSAPVSSAPMSSVPVSSAPAAGPPCLVPMWDDEEYACKEHEEFERNSFVDSLRRVRIEMPDGTKCTVTPPGKWSFWMASEVTEMMCKAGAWVDGKGKPVLEIEMKTALWFLIASAVSVGATIYVVYKAYYDPESSFYKKRVGSTPPVEDAGSAADASGPQPSVNISISNASGEAQPK